MEKEYTKVQLLDSFFNMGGNGDPKKLKKLKRN